VLRKFETELGVFRDCVFEGPAGVDPNEVARHTRFQYASRDPEFSHMALAEEVATEEFDLPALESLMAMVKSRRGDEGHSAKKILLQAAVHRDGSK
jgi:hypothetical protein